MLRHLILGVVLLGLGATGVCAQAIVAASWDAATLSAPRFAELVQALRALESVVEDRTYGSRRTLNEDGWTSRSFARYAGGVLSGMGYPVVLASGSAPGEADPWILVQVAAGGVAGWVPVVTTPAPGQAQYCLGRLAVAAASGTTVSFDVHYGFPTKTERLPPNVPPSAGLRVSSLSPAANSVLDMYSVLSRDPDGEIVLYRWRVGSDPWFATTSPSAAVPLTQAGYYPVVLQIVDNGGGIATKSVHIRVRDPETPKPAPDPGCGCGK